ncbi:nuclear transport factor 2 family protein [Amnibacterium endophyticum]|uniref:Nuclear transport factor 2 family protein n=1 Tax=Amnibacterium endophyticum TaxID=2109337 RepID=A0ABW4LJ24_9MICO
MSDANGMSLSADVPTPVRRFVDTTNAGDGEGLVQVFTEDAFLSDCGREHHGRQGVAEWDRTGNIGEQAHFDLLGCKPGATPQEVVATVLVSGDGYNGTSELAFTLRGEAISRLVITP